MWNFKNLKRNLRVLHSLVCSVCVRRHVSSVCNLVKLQKPIQCRYSSPVTMKVAQLLSQTLTVGKCTGGMSTGAAVCDGGLGDY